MQYNFQDDRLHITRTVEDKLPLFQRLNRIEGQVRGLSQMVENDRYWREQIQQTSAIVAAVREVTLMLITQHLEMAADSQRRDAVEEMRAVLRLALDHPVDENRDACVVPTASR